MKAYFTFCAIALFFAACQTGNKEDQSMPEENGTENYAVTGDNSRNALDWPGVYKGTIPCADCPGIETQIILKSDGTFSRSVKYLDRDENPRYDEGTFVWNEAGSNVTLQSQDGATQQYKVGENILFHLDNEGNMITGDLADQYRLMKNPADARLENKKWVLAEIMGQSVDTAALQSEAFLQFDPESGRFFGNSSCNNFFGSYELMEGDRIRFGQAGSTMMACPDMSIETQFLKILSQADNYNVNDTALSLNRARMAPLARFRAVETK